MEIKVTINPSPDEYISDTILDQIYYAVNDLLSESRDQYHYEILVDYIEGGSEISADNLSLQGALEQDIENMTIKHLFCLEKNCQNRYHASVGMHYTQDDIFYQDDGKRAYICNGHVCGYDGTGICSNCGFGDDE